jgi:hypothetical protein
MQWHNFIASWKIVNDSRPVGGDSEGKENEHAETATQLIEAPKAQLKK